MKKYIPGATVIPRTELLRLFPVIWENRTRILGTPEFSACHLGATTAFSPRPAGAENPSAPRDSLSLGMLLQLWNGGAWQSDCPVCRNRKYIFQCTGSLLGGNAGWKSFCTGCNRQWTSQATDKRQLQEFMDWMVSGASVLNEDPSVTHYRYPDEASPDSQPVVHRAGVVPLPLDALCELLECRDTPTGVLGPEGELLGNFSWSSKRLEDAQGQLLLGGHDPTFTGLDAPESHYWDGLTLWDCASRTPRIRVVPWTWDPGQALIQDTRTPQAWLLGPRGVLRLKDKAPLLSSESDLPPVVFARLLAQGVRGLE